MGGQTEETQMPGIGDEGIIIDEEVDEQLVDYLGSPVAQISLSPMEELEEAIREDEPI